MSVIAKVVTMSLWEIIKFAIYVRMKLISQLIISSVTQKLLKYFNDTAIFAFIIPSLLVLPNSFDLNLNNS